MRLRDALSECTLALLRRIASCHGLVVDETALRSELAECIAQRLTELDHLDAFLSTLSPAELDVLQAIRGQGWVARAFVMDRHFSGGLLGRARRRDFGSATPPSLVDKGLVYRGFAPVDAWRGEVYHVPEELRDSLCAQLAPLPERADHGVPLISPGISPDVYTERDVPYDLLCLLSFLRRADRRLARGALSKDEVARLDREMGDPGVDQPLGRADERWHFITWLCLGGGWVSRRGGTLKPSVRAPLLLRGDAASIRDRLLERYLRDRGWSDLTAAGRVRQALGTRIIDEPTGRRLLLHHLERLCGSGWVEEESLIALLRSEYPDLLREDYASSSWGIVDIATEAELYGPDCWERVEGEWVRYVLRGPLSWLGVLRYGRLPNQRTLALQMVARSVCDAVRQSAGAVGTPIRVTAEMQLLALTGGQEEIVYRLEPWTELVERGHPSRYRLTRTSVLSCLEQGGSWEELRELLEASPSVGIAESALLRLREWAGEYGGVALESAVLLSIATDEQAERVVKAPGALPLLGEREGPRSYRVARGRLQPLIEALKRAGIWPRVDPALRPHGKGRLAVDRDLLVECLAALQVLRSMQVGQGLEGITEALRRLEMLLEQDEAAEAARRAREITSGAAAGGDAPGAA